MADIGEPTDLKAQVAAWLEAERERIWPLLQRAGLPPTQRVMSPIASDITRSGYTTSHQPRDVNPLTRRVFLDPADELHTRGGPAASLYATFKDQCWFQDGWMKPNFTQEPERWIDDHLLVPTAWQYLRTIARLDQGSPELAERLAEELLDFARSDNITLRTSLVLEQPRVETTLTVAGITMRPLTPEEIGRFGADRLASFEGGFLGPPRQTGTTMLEIVESQDKRAWREPGTQLRRLLLALQLCGVPVSGVGYASEREEPIANGTRGTPVPIPRYGPQVDLDLPQLSRAADVAARIPVAVERDPRKPEEIALSRFGSAHGDRTATDALIDLVVSLEALLLPREPEAELRFRLALYGAYATGAAAGERLTVFKQLARVYDTRSKIVHGSRVDAAELQDVVAVAKRLTARILLRGIDQGWPSQDELRAMALGGVDGVEDAGQ
jgi:hypothetical protein